jgi:hypothetical protein
LGFLKFPHFPNPFLHLQDIPRKLIARLAGTKPGKRAGGPGDDDQELRIHGVSPEKGSLGGNANHAQKLQISHDTGGSFLVALRNASSWKLCFLAAVRGVNAHDAARKSTFAVTESEPKSRATVVNCAIMSGRMWALGK